MRNRCGIQKMLFTVFTIDPAGGGVHGRTASVGLIQSIEHDKVVDDGLESEGSHIHTRHTEFSRVSLAFIAEDVGFAI